ncbi:MAG: XRE family transcriptional regulator [Acidobacteria bacterium]|nr:XRE family transcriptional regulator [Acidobacteriota bacterium]
MSKLFEQLGFAPAQAADLHLRGQLMNAIIAHIESSGITHDEAARLMGVTQTQVSDLMRGRIDLFTLDTLTSMLAAALKPPPPAQAR